MIVPASNQVAKRLKLVKIHGNRPLAVMKSDAVFTLREDQSPIKTIKKMNTKKKVMEGLSINLAGIERGTQGPSFRFISGF